MAAKEFTPTTEEVCFRYVEHPYLTDDGEPADSAEFYRWLAEHDAATIADSRKGTPE